MFFLLNLSDSEDSNSKANDYEYAVYLYEKYYKTLWKYAFNISKNKEFSSDMVSTTLLKVIELIESIREIHPYKIRSYLMRMIKNNYLNYIDKEKLIVDLDSISEYILCNTDDDFTEKNDESEVQEILKHMPEPYRSILQYRYVYDELTFEEIALTLNINVKNIRVYKKRAIDMLRQRLKGGEQKHE